MFAQIGRAATNALNALYAFVVEGGWRESIEDLLDLSKETLTEDVTPFIQDRVDSLYELQTRVGRAIDAIRDDFPNLVPSPEPSSDCETQVDYIENFNPVTRGEWSPRRTFVYWQDAEEYCTSDTVIYSFSLVEVNPFGDAGLEFTVWVSSSSEIGDFEGDRIDNICDYMREYDENEGNDND
jgi:hypothetical protein